MPPAYKAACLSLEYWRRRLQMRGHAYKREKALQLQKALQKQLKLTNDPTLALEEILMKVKETYKERRRCKDLAEILTPRV